MRPSQFLPSCRPFTQPYDRVELLADGLMHIAGIGLAVAGLTLLTSMIDDGTLVSAERQPLLLVTAALASHPRKNTDASPAGSPRAETADVPEMG